MTTEGDAQLSRTPSHTSTTSRSSRRSALVRAKSRKSSSNASTTATGAENSDKSLTSFPSLSPPTSPSMGSLSTPPTIAVRRPVPVTLQRQASQVVLPSTVESLITATPSMRPRDALFDDDPIDSTTLPGALHHSTDEHINRLIARNGAIALVRQLAEDLAQRDAQASALRRRAEDRERVLRKMLIECEVSNMDIENRLTEAAKAERIAKQKRGSIISQSGHLIDDGIHALMSQAMIDDFSEEGDRSRATEASDGLPDFPRSSTLKRVMTTTSANDIRLVESLQKLDQRPRRTTTGWKDYILGSNGTTRHSSKANSIISETNDDMEATPKAKGRISSAGGRRKRLHGDLFQPPQNEIVQTSSRTDSVGNASGTAHEDESDAQSQKSTSSSVAAWALKLVAGNPGSVKRDVPLSKALLAHESRRSSNASGTALHPARPISAGSTGQPKVHNSRRSAPPLNLGPNGTVKAPNPAKVLTNGSSLQVGAGETDSTISGPLEMDTILPPELQPPTVTQAYNDHHPTEYLTDRFGFIYDQRRKKRQKEAAAGVTMEEAPERKQEMLSPSRTSFGAVRGVAESNRDSDIAQSSLPQHPTSSRSSEGVDDNNPMKGWQDFLRSATFPTELLSHTPSAGPITLLHSVETAVPHRAPSQIFVAGRGPLPSASLNPQPLATAISSDNATFVKATDSAPSSPLPIKTQTEPVKLLLEQLTELHDSLQRDRTTKWNEFLRKVRAERRREGEAAAVTESKSRKNFVPEVLLGDGEMVGVAGLGNKGKVGKAKWNEFVHLVLGGIPVAFRAKIWTECSGAMALRVPGQYEDLVHNGTDDPTIVAQIAMDINRTLTDNVFFRDGPGVAKLNEVLLAYARRNPEVGYCQGMNLITASLLLIMPTAEDAFWILASMIERILPAKYYDHSLLASRADQQVLRQYVAKIMPALSAHLDHLGVELEALTFQWFLSIFTDCLSAEALFRVWDVILCTNDGSTFLFQVALALLKLNEQSLLRNHTPAGVYTYINHQMTNHAISIDGLLQASDGLKRVVKRDEVEERRAKAVEAEEALMKERAERYKTRSIRVNTAIASKTQVPQASA